MDRFKSILVATSPGHLDPFTLRAAVKLADANDARLAVLDVVAPLPARRRKMNVEGRVIDIEAAILHDREERLRHVLENTRGGPGTAVIETVGEPFIEVIRQVLVGGYDLVMVGEPAGEKPDEPHLSSGVMHLLRKCPVPVWVMRSGRSGTGRVLALVDSDPDDPVRDGLNDLIMELATSLAIFKIGSCTWDMPGPSPVKQPCAHLHMSNFRGRWLTSWSGTPRPCGLDRSRCWPSVT